MSETAILRALRDIADGHIILTVCVERFNPATGEPVSPPRVLWTAADRAVPGASGEWWLSLWDRGWLRLPEARERQLLMVTDAGVGVIEGKGGVTVATTQADCEAAMAAAAEVLQAHSTTPQVPGIFAEVVVAHLVGDGTHGRGHWLAHVVNHHRRERTVRLVLRDLQLPTSMPLTGCADIEAAIEAAARTLLARTSNTARQAPSHTKEKP